MSTPDPLQTSSSHDFPVERYDSARETHFWMTWRLNVILRHLRRLNIDGRAALKGFGTPVCLFAAFMLFFVIQHRALSGFGKRTMINGGLGLQPATFR